MSLRLATRGSPLALWQAQWVADALVAAHPGLDVEIGTFVTEGDRRVTEPLSEIGGKGTFVKEIQAAVLDGRADVAVHSAKDLPAGTPPGLSVAAWPERADPRDVLVGAPLDGLGAGAVVGTGSARRRALLADLRPEVRVVDLRGNIHTRLGRVGELTAVVSAAAALERLAVVRDDVHHLDAAVFVPQVGQGALAVECRSDDDRSRELVAALDHAATRVTVAAERAFLAELGGDCSLPAGAHATLSDGEILIRGVLGGEGSALRRLALGGTDPDTLGRDLARALLGGGAGGP